MFENRYSCDLIIQQRKYTSNKHITKKPIRLGEVWSAIPIDLESHYEPIKEQLESMPLTKRHDLESKTMDTLQGDSKQWKRYYAISSEWVQKWLNWVQASDKSKAVHPGPVDNNHLVTELTPMNKGEEQPRQEFYNVNKHLFYFFVSLYGGGPALV